MATREIQGHLKELYGTEASPALISAVTDAVLEDVQAWQSRPLDPLYPIVYLDAIHLKLRTDGRVQTQAVYRKSSPFPDGGGRAGGGGSRSVGSARVGVRFRR
jgi:transposase-like protein